MIIEGGSHGIFATHYQEVGAEIEAFLLEPEELTALKERTCVTNRSRTILRRT